MLPVIPCTANMAWFHGCPQLEHQANHFMIAKNKPYVDENIGEKGSFIDPYFLSAKKPCVAMRQAQI